MEKGKMTIIEKAAEAIKNITFRTLQKWNVNSHISTCYKWIAIYSDGEICEMEDVNKPNQQNLEILYWINSRGNVPCNCDTCKMIADFAEMNEDDFLKKYTEYDYNICSFYDKEEILKNSGDFYPTDIYNEMLINLKTIPYGYFDDEF